MAKVLTEADLVSFGNFLLSKERKERFAQHPDFPEHILEERLSQVHDADLANWKEENGIEAEVEMEF